MTLLTLFLTFFKIGLFTFGGGYGMIPLIQQEALAHGWLDAETLYRYIGICESTPGPIAVNMATFVGASQAGLAGSLCATVGVVLPSFVIILLIAAVMKSFRENRYVKAALRGIKPVVAGMIAATGLYIALKCMIVNFGMLSDMSVDLRQAGITAALGGFVLIWVRALKRPFSPILTILVSAALGIVIYGI